jgi:hypothetical protein
MSENDKVRYRFISPDLPEELQENCLSILNSLDHRKVDKVNWEERAAMDVVSRRSGKFIGKEEAPLVESKVDEKKLDEISKEVPKKKSTKLKSKEEDLMEALGGVMNILEGYDGKK